MEENDTLHHIQLALAGGVKLRDFAYLPFDSKHWLKNLLLENKESALINIDASIDFSGDLLDEDDMEDVSNDKEDVQPLVKLFGITLAESLSHISNLLDKSLSLPSPITLANIAVLYSFDKGGDWEMSVKEGEEIIVLNLEKSSNLSSSDSISNVDITTNNETSQMNDRWSSIDDVDKEIKVEALPDLESISEDLSQFLKGAEMYGEGWVVGCRLKIIANVVDCNEGYIKTEISEIGLVPKNYLDI
ncbi:hypothetical protein HK096_002218 [Nowakowskiella sp. JEL0078]|nr:hypothetical protein HK096_002218 [Nowakowskiella sp. JEL0078]